jgi:hypothetical protein
MSKIRTTSTALLDAIAWETAADILRRHAPDCLHRPGLHEAIAHLARLGLEGHLQLYQLGEQEQGAE